MNFKFNTQRLWRGLQNYIVLMMVLSTNLNSAEKQLELYERDLGASRCTLIEESDISGGLIYEGRYIQPPYLIRRVGRAVFVNNIIVCLDPTWPMPDLTVKEDPGQPEGLTRNSKWEDLKTEDKRFGDHYELKRAYFLQHIKDRAEIVRQTIQYFKKMPCVKKVYPATYGSPDYDPNKIETTPGLNIQFYSGDATNIGFEYLDGSDGKYSNPTTYMIEGKGDVINYLENRKRSLYDSLFGGKIVDLYFLGEEDRPIHKLASNVYKREKTPVWVLAAKILMSDDSPRKKLYLLQRMGIYSSRFFLPYLKIITESSGMDKLRAKLLSNIFASPASFKILHNIERKHSDKKQDDKDGDDEDEDEELQINPLDYVPTINDFPNRPGKHSVDGQEIIQWWNKLQALPEDKWGPKLSENDMPDEVKTLIKDGK